MIDQILNPVVQKFIRENENVEVEELILAYSKHSDISLDVVVPQILALRKAKKKLPRWYGNQNVVFPPLRALEQCSSDRTAAFKQSRFGGKKALDLTGGAGVDSLFLSDCYKHVDFIDEDLDLVELAAHNHRMLGASNIKHYCGKAEDYLESIGNYDLIYIDPSRRGHDNRRLFKLEDYSPNILELIPPLLEKTDKLLVKISPWIDLQHLQGAIPKLSKIIVLAVDNECKEILILVESTSRRLVVETVNLQKNSSHQQFSFHPKKEQNAKATYSEPGKYLYEPNAAILKAGAFKLVSEELGLNKLHPNTHLYTSDQPLQNFPGRVFSIASVCKYDRKALRAAIEIDKANISTRNFPDSVEIVKKKLKLKDGGSMYIFGARLAQDQPRLLVCNRV